MAIPAYLTRDEAFGLLAALEDDPWWYGPTINSHNLVMYIIERDDERGVAHWVPEDCAVFHPCNRAFVRHDCPLGHQWRPLTDDEGMLTYIPFDTGDHTF